MVAIGRFNQSDRTDDFIELMEAIETKVLTNLLQDKYSNNICLMFVNFYH